MGLESVPKLWVAVGTQNQVPFWIIWKAYTVILGLYWGYISLLYMIPQLRFLGCDARSSTQYTAGQLEPELHIPKLGHILSKGLYTLSYILGVQGASYIRTSGPK